MDDLLRGGRVIYLYFYLGFEFWVSSFGFWVLGFGLWALIVVRGLVGG